MQLAKRKMGLLMGYFEIHKGQGQKCLSTWTLQKWENFVLFHLSAAVRGRRSKPPQLQPLRLSPWCASLWRSSANCFPNVLPRRLLQFPPASINSVWMLNQIIHRLSDCQWQPAMPHNFCFSSLCWQKWMSQSHGRQRRPNPTRTRSFVFTLVDSFTPAGQWKQETSFNKERVSTQKLKDDRSIS